MLLSVCLGCLLVTDEDSEFVHDQIPRLGGGNLYLEHLRLSPLGFVGRNLKLSCTLVYGSNMCDVVMDVVDLPGLGVALLGTAVHILHFGVHVKNSLLLLAAPCMVLDDLQPCRVDVSVGAKRLGVWVHGAHEHVSVGV